MVSRSVVIVLALFFGSFCAYGDEPKTDLQRFQGSWKFVKFEMRGKSAPAKLIDEARYVFKGNTLLMYEGDKKVGEAEFSLDPTKKPQSIDLTGTEALDKGKTRYGIYRIEGDSLILCFGEERPTEFSGANKAGLIQLRREKPK